MSLKHGSPAASELHLGKVAGEPPAMPHATPVITTAGTPYSAGDLVGSKLTFSNVTRLPGGSGMAMFVGLFSKTAQNPSLELVLFHADPTNTVFSDNAPFSLNPSDFDKVADVISLTDWRTYGATSFARAPQLALPFSTASGSKDLYGAIVAKGAFTIATVGDLKSVLKVLPD